MKNHVKDKYTFRIAFSILLSLAIIALSLTALAYSRRVEALSFSPSQTMELTENKRSSADFSSKIGEEISDLFNRGNN